GHGETAEDEPGHDQLAPGGLAAHAGPDDAQLGAEHDLQHETGDEHRQRDQEQRRDQHQVVEEAAAAQTGQHARSDADDRLDHQGHHREADGHGIGVGDQLADLDSRIGLPEIPLQQLPQVLEVLDEDR